MKPALRWRAVGRCASQQDGEQKISLRRPLLQVETVQRISLAPYAMGALHIEQVPKTSGDTSEAYARGGGEGKRARGAIRLINRIRKSIGPPPPGIIEPVRLFGYVVAETCAVAVLAVTGAGAARWLSSTPAAQASRTLPPPAVVAPAAQPPPASPPRRAPSFIGLDDEQVMRALRTEPVVRVKFNKGGSTISLRLTFADGSQAAFKPAQTHQFSNPRKEVAAYRLSRLLGIDRVAPAVPRVLHRDEIVKHLEPGSWSVLPRILNETRFDAEGRTAGMAQYWIPKIKDSNLEQPAMVAAWTGWLAPGKPAPESKRALAAQLSNLVIFDLLINNRDRHSGGNMKISEDDQTLYFMDNTAAFFPPQSGHPKLRTLVQRVGQYSARTVEALRGLTFESVTAELAREPGAPYEILSPEEIRGLLQRRDFVLEHVDALIAKHGRDAVLTFE